MRPGTNVTTLTAIPDQGPPVNTGTWFVAGITSQGPTGSQLVTSFQQYQQFYGQRGLTPLLSDCVETFFKEGGSQVYVARVTGPAVTAANVLLKDGSNASSLGVFGIGPGAYANGYQVIVAGSAGNYTITIEDASSTVLEQSGTLTSNADAVAYGKFSSYVSIISAGPNSPAAGTFSLAGGVDDLTHVGDTQYTNALNVFSAQLGPGQVSVPGQSDQTILTALFQHAQSNNRVAVCDMVDSPTVGTLTAEAGPIMALAATARFGGMFAPWLDIAPVQGSIALRPVPPSPFVAAACARVDALGNQNLPAAGRNGILSTPVALHVTFSDADRSTLNLAGVNVIKPVWGEFRIYGFRSGTNATNDPNYWQLNNIRLDMAIVAEAQPIQENFVFSQIDGQGIDASHYGNALKAMLLPYFTAGALFGDTPQDAFTVDVGPDVNTPLSESQGTLTATIACRRSPEAELVQLNIVRVPITQAV